MRHSIMSAGEMHNRYCLLGLPRTGSNYCASLIRKNMSTLFGDVKILSEPYTPGQGEMIIETGMLSRTSTSTDLCSLKEHAYHVNSVIRHSDISQPIILKVFIFREMVEFSKEIIDTLVHANFKFVINKRLNIEQQILSIALAHSTGLWLSEVGCYKHTSNIVTDIGFDNMRTLYKNILDFDDHIKRLGVSAPVIYYESMKDGIAEVLGIPNSAVDMTSNMKKQGTENLYDCIENQEEVREFIKKLFNAEPREI